MLPPAGEEEQKKDQKSKKSRRKDEDQASDGSSNQFKTATVSFDPCGRAACSSLSFTSSPLY